MVMLTVSFSLDSVYRHAHNRVELTGHTPRSVTADHMMATVTWLWNHIQTHMRKHVHVCYVRG